MDMDYQSFFENAIEGIYRSTPGGRFTIVNPALAAMLGYDSPQEMIDTITDISSQLYADPKVTKEILRQFKQQEVINDLEVLVMRKDGSTTWVTLNIRALKDKNGKINFIEGFVQDTTKRKQAEETLKDSEERYNSLFQNSHTVMLLIDPETSAILDANPAAIAFYGWTREELLRKRVDEINTLTPSEIQEEMKLALTEKRNRFHFRHRRSDGSIRDVEVFSNPILQGGKTLLYSIIHDITERKKMEQDLLQSETIFSSFLENSPVYVFFKDKDIRTVRLSSNYDQMLGMPISQAIGKTMDELFPFELAKKMVADDLRILNEGKRVDVVEELNGHIYETTKFPIFKDGKPDMLAGFTIDVTERKKAEQTLWEVEAFNQAIITNSPIGISVRSRTGDLLSANQAWKRIWGLQEEEYQAMLLEKSKKLEFDARDASLEQYQDQVRQVYEQGGILDLPDLKVRIFRPGIAEWVSQYYYAIKDDKGQVVRVVTLTEDISARKQAETEILKSRAFLERIQEVAHMGSWEVDLKTRQVTASDEARRIYGVETEELDLSFVQAIVLDEYRPVLDTALSALIKGEAEYNVEFRIQRRSDGAIRDIHSVAEFNPNDNTVIGSIQDITERKEAERELKKQLDLLERMNNVMVDRELRMLEIKKEVNALLLKAGEKEKYRIFEL